MFMLTTFATVPATPVWSPVVGLIISLSSIVSILLATQIECPHVGTKMPVLPISIPTFIAAMCLGHILGIGITLGLTNIGYI